MTIGSDTIAMVSHDLKSTLNALGVTMDLLSEGHLGALNEKGLKLVSSSSAAVRLLINMTHSLIDSEQMDAGLATINYQSVCVKSMVEEAVCLLESQFVARGLNIIIDVRPIRIKADPERLARVFLNLLDNAIKFSPQGAVVWITARVAGDNLEIRFIDEGAGVPSDKLEGIFNKFQRAHDGQVPGFGLGLAICKSIVEAHGGSLGAENCVGGGSCFWIKIPMEPQP